MVNIECQDAPNHQSKSVKMGTNFVAMKNASRLNLKIIKVSAP